MHKYRVIVNGWRGLLMKLLQRFARNMKMFRVEREFSQEKLAELAGLHRTYISAVERGKRNISIDSIEKISNALEVDAMDLFKL